MKRVILLACVFCVAASAEAQSPSIQVLTSGDNSELVKTIPIKRVAAPTKVMSLDVGDLTLGRVIDASAEVEVTVCLKKNPLHDGEGKDCTGKAYGYDPKIQAALSLGNQQLASKQITCKQTHPNRNHHCVIAFNWVRALSGCASCDLDLFLSATHPKAKRGHKVVVGADSHGPIKQDKGRVNAIVYSSLFETSPLISTTPQIKKIPVAADGADPEMQVVYAQKIPNPREGEQIMVSSRVVTSIKRLSYNVFLPAQVIVARDPHTTRKAGVAVYTDPSSDVSELNGVNCTQGKSAHSDPCVRVKVGVVRISRDTEELWINVVMGAEAKVTTQKHSRGDAAKIMDGYLKVWRFS